MATMHNVFECRVYCVARKQRTAILIVVPFSHYLQVMPKGWDLVFISSKTTCFEYKRQNDYDAT